MNKINRITMIVLSLLLCAVLAATSVFSGTLAKYVTQRDYDHELDFSTWKVDINCLNDARSTYIKDSNKIVVEASNQSNVVVPGTRGALMCIHVDGNIGVESTLDFEGTFSIGKGFLSSARYVRDEKGLAVDYFPIIINLYKLDVIKTSDLEGSTDIVWDDEIKDIVVKGDPDDFTYTKTLVGSYGMQKSADTNAPFTVYSAVSAFSTGFNTALDTVLDEATLNDVVMDRYYVVEWEWPYEAPSGSSYQTNQLDTSLCEAVANNKDSTDFNIKLDMKVTLSQKT